MAATRYEVQAVQVPAGPGGVEPIQLVQVIAHELNRGWRFLAVVEDHMVFARETEETEETE